MVMNKFIKNKTTKGEESRSKIPKVVQHLVLPLGKVIQVLTQSQDVVALPARCRVDPPSLHAAAETADGSTLVGQVDGSLHDAWEETKREVPSAVSPISVKHC